MNFTPFETPRLRLRPQEARDAGFALCIWGDPITGKYLSDTPLDAIDDLNEYMELLRHLSDAPDCYYMIAEDKVTGQPSSKTAAPAGISVTASTPPAGGRAMPKKW